MSLPPCWRTAAARGPLARSGRPQPLTRLGGLALLRVHARQPPLGACRPHQPSWVLRCLGCHRDLHVCWMLAAALGLQAVLGALRACCVLHDCMRRPLHVFQIFWDAGSVAGDGAFRSEPCKRGLQSQGGCRRRRRRRFAAAPAPGRRDLLFWRPVPIWIPRSM